MIPSISLIFCRCVYVVMFSNQNHITACFIHVVIKSDHVSHISDLWNPNHVCSCKQSELCKLKSQWNGRLYLYLPYIRSYVFAVVCLFVVLLYMFLLLACSSGRTEVIVCSSAEPNILRTWVCTIKGPGVQKQWWLEALNIKVRGFMLSGPRRKKCIIFKTYRAAKLLFLITQLSTQPLLQALTLASFYICLFIYLYYSILIKLLSNSITPV